ncbi:GDP-L-fucose synthase [Acidocella sp.]|uniref:GDP-L-fucose synthase family protein n=1 Tax=Acidocella sp. TaxID=50710 RepID=UPI002635775C|nr:GDP-L-fucose synthase [Acidocella sp.]
MDNNARIYVAGHTGLIGSALIRGLQKRGITLLVRRRAELDLLDGAMVERFFSAERPDYVVLAAGKVGGIVENRDYPADFLRENLAIQLNVLQAAHRAGVRKLIFFGSSCMYPSECPQPMAETALLTGLPEPTSLAYAVSKLAGLQMCLAYNQQFGEQRFIPVIPNSVFGPNDNFDPARGHVLSSLIRRLHEAKMTAARRITLWGSGEPRREFVYADDVADACIALLEQDTAALHLPLNIGTGVDVSIRELAASIAGIIGYDGLIEWDTSMPDGAPRKLLDSSRIRSSGWEPKTSLQAGLHETYQWYLRSAYVNGAARQECPV